MIEVPRAALVADEVSLSPYVLKNLAMVLTYNSTDQSVEEERTFSLPLHSAYSHKSFFADCKGSRILFIWNQ